MRVETKQVIVVRKDLNMRKGKMAAQAAHASMKVFVDMGNFLDTNAFFASDLPDPMMAWFNGQFTKVVVGCDSIEDLLILYMHARRLEIPCAIITDAGKTEFKKPTETCIAIGPYVSEKIDEITGHLKLL